MKKLVFCCLMAVLACGTAVAAGDQPAKGAKKGTIVTTVFTTDIDCDHCAKRIENNVPTIGKGIKDLRVDVPAKEVTVTYDSSKTSPEELIKGFGKIRVKAEVKAEK